MKTDSISYEINELPVPIPGHESSTHLYLIQSDKTALIDTGPAATSGVLLDRLQEIKVNPEQIDFILCTHIHLDHLGGLSRVLRAMPQAKVIVHPRGVAHLHQPQKLWQASLEISGQVALNYGQPEGVAAERLTAAREGQCIDLGGICLEVLYTPGHAAHHLSYIDRKFGNLFAGESA
ncbi:MAG TPA: MBL fold metallo-hydrolase, partial [Dehalococcoidales bacterium]|nr:MBL fold metallo-hydrolase [Dehalococcoidales bacterium]